MSSVGILKRRQTDETDTDTGLLKTEEEAMKGISALSCIVQIVLLPPSDMQAIYTTTFVSVSPASRAFM